MKKVNLLLALQLCALFALPEAAGQPTITYPSPAASFVTITEAPPGGLSFNFSDNGGSTNNYSDGYGAGLAFADNPVVSFCPAASQSGDQAQVSFSSFNVEATFDALYIHNGNSIGSPLFSSGNGFGNTPLGGGWWGTALPPTFVSTHPSGCLTFRFFSDGAVNFSGWQSLVTFLHCIEEANPVVCANSTGNVYSAPAGMSAYNWSVSGNGTMVGSSTGSSVTVTAGAAGAFTAMVTVTDANGGTSTCSKTLTVNALPNPGITVAENSGTPNDGAVCAGASANLTATGGGTYAWSTGATTAAIAVFPVSTTTYTVTVTAANGCTATATQIITVNSVPSCPITGPNIVCPNSAGHVYSAPGGMSSYLWSTSGNGTITTLATNASVTVQPGVPGSFTMVAMVMDANGCANTCSKIVSVVDNVAPTITCPPNATVSANANCQGQVGSYNAATLSDNCNPAPMVTQSPASSTLLSGHNTTQTVTLTANDGNGNTGTCSFTVTLLDTQNPSIACPGNISKSADANQCTAVTNYATPTFSDNCSGATLSRTSGSASGAAFPAGVTMVEWKVTDAAGLSSVCQFTVTVTDGQAPSITCPASQTRSADAGQCSAVTTYASPTASDNCSGVTLTRTAGLASGSQFPVGTTNVVWQASDGSSLANTATCTFTVTVNDTQLPTVSCPGNVTKGTDAGLCTAVTNYATPTMADNCSGGSVSLLSGLPSGQPFPKGITIVTWKATDGAGLTKTCTFRVTVNDTQAPTISCPASQSLNTDANLCSATASYATPTASDNCTPPPTVVKTSGLASGSAFPKGASTVVWKATDGAGLMKTCSFTVTVTDVQLPTISCPANLSVTGSGSPCTATVAYATPTGTDNCAVQSLFLLSGLGSGSLFPQGVTTCAWRAVDNSGLSATCAFTVTVGCQTSGPSQPPRRGGDVTAERDVVSGVVAPPLRGGWEGPYLLLAPNPATTEVQILMEGWGETGGGLTVTDAQGRTVWQWRFGSETLTSGAASPSHLLTVSLLDFAAGMYFVTLRSEGRTVTKRLVVQRL